LTRPRACGLGPAAFIFISVAGAALPLVGPRQAQAAPKSDDAALLTAWNAIPPLELSAAWNDAQRTGGVIVVEPDSPAIGAQAGQKKTWELADRALKLVWGDAPNWFPADLVRRTTCGTDARWSYFWHALSGDERDLHPWIGQASAFGHLLGPRYAAALVGSKALFLGPCVEVGGGATEECLYGEVTPPEPFEHWFCGGPKATCKDRLTADPTRVPPEFAHPSEVCFAGPWVMERVHAWRPEIHPAEIVWARTAPDRPRWYFALIPDASGRFDKPKHFATLGGASPRPWSQARPVEMWIAFASEPSRPIVLDLSQRKLKKNAEATRTATLEVASGAQGFVAWPHGLGSGLLAAVRSWIDPACDCTRGFVVLRTTYPKKEREASLLALTGRRPDEAPPASPFGSAPVLESAALERAPLVEPAIRLLSFTRVEPRQPFATAVVNVMARFDVKRPGEPKDEILAERSNEALAGNDRGREAYFGTRRPFEVHWTLEAFRESSGARVPIVVPGRGRIAEGTDPEEVKVVPFRGKATAEMTLNSAGPPPIEKAAADVVSLGQLLVTLPAGVVLKGTGRIDYIGPTPLELDTSAVVAFRVPRPAYASEWDLVRQILKEIDRDDKAGARAQQLMADACHPVGAGCTLDAFNEAASARIADPVARWATLRELQEPRRSMARFVRLFARSLVWDKWADDDEGERLKRLLAAVYSSEDP
jgi:hypothetical protein